MASENGKIDPFAAEAIAWMVLLRSGEATAEDEARYHAWCEADPRHEAAAKKLASALGVFQLSNHAAASRRIVRDALLQAPVPSRRKFAAAALSFAAVSATAGLLADRFIPLATMTADLSTGTGERRRLVLADGSRLTLNARSAADIELTDSARVLCLRDGELFVEVAHDATRPFDVVTRDGTLRALGTAFSVTVEEGGTIVAVTESAVSVTTRGGQTARVEAGQRVRFDGAAILSSASLGQDALSWTDGRLVVEDESLAAVVDKLRPYHRGWIVVSPQAAPLRVSGVFPLDRVEVAVQALSAAAPIRARRLGPWINIERI